MPRNTCSSFTRVALLLLFLLPSSQCRTTKTEGDTLEKTVKSKLGKEFSEEYNQSRTFILYKQEENPEKIGEPLKYLVVRVSDTTIVQEGYFTRGYVKWIDNKTIEVLNLPGKVEQDEYMDKFKKQIVVDETSPVIKQ